MTQIFSKKRGEKGFTLIELLVVIAIIGILAGIVLVALGGARTRAKDARIISAMAQMRTQAEIYQVDVGSYGVGALEMNCAAPTVPADIESICADADLQNGGNGGRPLIVVSATGDAYCAWVVMATSNATTPDVWYCVDSTGRANTYSGAANNPTTDGRCLEDLTPTYVCQ